MTSLQATKRAFNQPKTTTSETPALIAPETFADPGRILIGQKGYCFRVFPGGKGTTCKRILRLYCGNGFEDSTYDVAFFSDRRPLCTCADFIYRDRENTGTTCKHIRAAVALDLHKTDGEKVTAIEAAVADLAKWVRDVTAGRVGTADLQGGF